MNYYPPTKKKRLQMKQNNIITKKTYHVDENPMFCLGQNHKQAFYVPHLCSIQPVKQGFCDGYS